MARLNEEKGAKRMGIENKGGDPCQKRLKMTGYFREPTQIVTNFRRVKKSDPFDNLRVIY